MSKTLPAIPMSVDDERLDNPGLSDRQQTNAKRFRRDRTLLMIGIPGLVLILVFQYVPLLGNVIAFLDYQPYGTILSSPWVGLQNFQILVSGDPAFLDALRNTLVISLIQIVFTFPVPILLALLLNSLLSQRLRDLVQTILLLPHFLSWVVIVAMFQVVLGPTGFINEVLSKQGLDPIHVIGSPAAFPWLLALQVTWKDAGFGTVLFLAAISRVDVELYEAVSVDGGGRLRQLWHVTVPAMRSIIVLLLILRLGDVLSVGFEQIFLQQDAVGLGASEVLDTYVYHHGILGGTWGPATAVGMVKSIVALALILAANGAAHRVGERGIYTKHH